MAMTIVLRLMGDKRDMLGWASVPVQPRMGTLVSVGDVEVQVSQGGTAVSCSLHWVEVDALTALALPASQPVAVGDRLKLFTAGDPVLRVGDPAEGLPAVTVGMRDVAMPVGSAIAIPVRSPRGESVVRAARDEPDVGKRTTD